MSSWFDHAVCSRDQGFKGFNSSLMWKMESKFQFEEMQLHLSRLEHDRKLNVSKCVFNSGQY